MPRPSLWLVRPQIGEHAMRGSTFLGKRQIHDRRAHKGVAKRKPVVCLVQIRQSCLLRGHEISDAPVVSPYKLQDTDISSAIQGHEQQELPRLMG